MSNIENEFKNWIQHIDSANPQIQDIKAFNFGLFEVKNGFSAYLIGSVKYEENDDDWACQVDFTPNEKYFELPSYFTDEKQWLEVQNDFKDVIETFMKSDDFKCSFLSKVKTITIGFDDGDLDKII